MASFDLDKLVCYGCAHSASGREYPSCPSGEWACGHCIRAYKHDGYDEDEADKDLYITMDRRHGPCDSCDAEKAWLVGSFCTECYSFIEQAKNTEI